MFSMSLPAHLLEQIPVTMRKSMLRLADGHSPLLTTGAEFEKRMALSRGDSRKERMLSVPSFQQSYLSDSLVALEKNTTSDALPLDAIHSVERRSLLNRSSLNKSVEHTFEEGGDETAFQTQLLQGQLLRGGIVELCSEGGAAFGTSIALRACRRVQAEARKLHGESSWCAFIDPQASLYAPGVRSAGVDLSRLLIVRPDEEALSRVALRLVESKAFPLVVIDTMGLPGSTLHLSLGPWVRVVRRLALSLRGSASTVVLLTNKNARRPLPLPVTQRIELSRSSAQELNISVPKSLHKAMRRPTRIRWSHAS